MAKSFFAKKRFKIILIAAAVLVVAGIVGAKFLAPAAKTEYVTAKVEKKDLLQTVKEVGEVKAEKEVLLGFLSSGNLENKFVHVGDEVRAGDILAELDYKSLQIQRTSAESNLSSTQANLKKLLAGATPADIAVVEAQTNEAQRAYESSLSNLDKTKKTIAEETRQAQKTLQDLQSEAASDQTTYEQAVFGARTALDNTKATYQKSINNSIDTLLADIGAKVAVANTALDNVNTILTDDLLKDFLSAKNKTYLANTKTGYLEAEALAIIANTSLYNALEDKSEVNVKKAGVDALNYLNKTSTALNDCYSALEASTISPTPLGVHKTTISTQMSSVNAALAVVQADKQGLDSAYLSYNTSVSAAENSLRQAEVAKDNAVIAAKNALNSTKVNGEQRLAAAEASVRTSQQGVEVAKNQLAKLKSPARNEDVVLANAQISQAQASLDLVNKQVQDSILRAPIDGKIVKDNFERGEQITPGKTVFSLLGKNNYKIEVYISESDIAKVKEGNEAEVTLDAFGEDRNFKAVVSFVEPAETVIQDVIYYKVVLNFSDDASALLDIRPGMTANVTIVTAKRDQVLLVPERAVVDKNGNGKVVRILRSGKAVESPVKTGLRGDGGLVEITSGAANGDEVVVFVKVNKK